MARLTLCHECGQLKPLHGNHLCDPCYLKHYRARPEYREQRLQYDIQYTLKIMMFEAAPAPSQARHVLKSTIDK